MLFLINKLFSVLWNPQIEDMYVIIKYRHESRLNAIIEMKPRWYNWIKDENKIKKNIMYKNHSVTSKSLKIVEYYRKYVLHLDLKSIQVWIS